MQQRSAVKIPETIPTNNAILKCNSFDMSICPIFDEEAVQYPGILVFWESMKFTKALARERIE